MATQAGRRVSAARIALSLASALLGCIVAGCGGGGAAAAVPAAVGANLSAVAAPGRSNANLNPSPGGSTKPSLAPTPTATSGSAASPPAQTPLQAWVPKHSPTFEFAWNSVAAYNASYGMNGWSYVAPYLSMIGTNLGIYNTAAQAAGVPLVQYVDPNLCSGSFASGLNPYPSLDCAPLSSAAFYSEPGYPDRPLTTAYQNSIQQRFGDPNSPSLLTALQAFIATSAAANQINAVFVDDANTPDEYRATHSSAMCWGVGTFSGTYTCAGAPGGNASSPWGSTYSKSAWQSGEANIAASNPSPVIFNGLGITDGVAMNSAIASVAASAANVWGAMCEGCFYGFSGNPAGANLYTGRILDQALGDVMLVVGAGRHVIVQNDNVLDPGARARALADLMLVYDPTLIYEGGPCGANSHISACIEAALVFEQPVGPYPAAPAALRSSGGAYVRQFLACYVSGSPVGPCAAAVNPNLSTAVPLPPSLTSFGHTLQLSGDALCQCFGDSGSVSVTGPAAPAILPPASGYVLFR